MSLQNLFVAKLPRNLTDNDLQQIFAPYDPSSAKIMLDAATGRSKGFGFVLFDSVEKGEKAYKALNRKSTRACGHNFTLAIYPSNHDGKIATEASNSLYIRNIPITVPQEKVENFLRTFGNLTYCAMREDHYGSPVWVVYAEYERIEDAKNALTKLHGNSTYFHGSAPILAKYEDTDDAKRERRKRREGTGNSHSVPNSGCIFPPPRPHTHGSHEASSSHHHDNGNRSDHSQSGGYPSGVGPGALPAGMATSSSAMNSWDTACSAPTPGTKNYLFAKHAPPPPRLDGGHRGLADVPASTMLHTQHALHVNGSGTMGSNSASQSPPNNHGNTSSTLQSALAAAIVGSPQNPGFPLPMAPQLLQPTPGYCYTLSGSGQQIFIPASSLSPSADLAIPHAALAHGSVKGDGSPLNTHFSHSHGVGNSLSSGIPFSSSPLPGVGAGLGGRAVLNAPPYLTPSVVAGQSNSVASGGAGSESGNPFPLLSPQPTSPVVLVDGSRQYVLSGDAVNVGQRSLGTATLVSPSGHGPTIPLIPTAAGDAPMLFPGSSSSPPAFADSPSPHTSSRGAGDGVPLLDSSPPASMSPYSLPSELKQQSVASGSVGDQSSDHANANPQTPNGTSNYLFRATAAFSV